MILALTRSCRAHRVNNFAISNRFAGVQSSARSCSPCSKITREEYRFITRQVSKSGLDIGGQPREVRTNKLFTISMKHPELNQEWLLKNWVDLRAKGMSSDELTVIYWRDFERKSFKQCGLGLKGGRELGRRIYARGRRKLEKLLEAS